MIPLMTRIRTFVISEVTAGAIKGEAEFACLGEGFASTLAEEIKPVMCYGGGTTMLSS
jgi:hypothetical protein